MGKVTEGIPARMLHVACEIVTDEKTKFSWRKTYSPYTNKARRVQKLSADDLNQNMELNIRITK